MSELIALLLITGIFTLLALCSDGLERVEKKADSLVTRLAEIFADSLL